MFLLDTNVISELRRKKPHGAVVAWLQGINDRDLHISAVSVGEIQAGIEATRARDPAKAIEIEGWLDRLEATFRVLPMDGHAFREWARLMCGQSDTLIEDAMIAATARMHNLTVVTPNLKDFASFGVPTLDPFRN